MALFAPEFPVGSAPKLHPYLAFPSALPALFTASQISPESSPLINQILSDTQSRKPNVRLTVIIQSTEHI